MPETLLRDDPPTDEAVPTNPAEVGDADPWWRVGLAESGRFASPRTLADTLGPLGPGEVFSAGPGAWPAPGAAGTPADPRALQEQQRFLQDIAAFRGGSGIAAVAKPGDARPIGTLLAPGPLREVIPAVLPAA